MMTIVGHRNTELALELGLLYNPSDALKLGLVDQLAPEDQILTTATQAMTKWLAIPGITTWNMVCSIFSCTSSSH